MDKQKELDDYSHGIQTWYYNNSEMDIGELVKRVVEDTRRAAILASEQVFYDYRNFNCGPSRSEISQAIREAVPELECEPEPNYERHSTQEEVKAFIETMNNLPPGEPFYYSDDDVPELEKE